MTDASLTRQSVLEQKLASRWNQLSATVLTASVAVESKLASFLGELVVANNTIGKVRSEEKTGRDQMGSNWQQASIQYSLADWE